MVFSLLQELYGKKKHFLEEFLKITSSGLVQFSQGNFDQIESFYSQREGVLEILQFLDNKIAQEEIFTKNHHLSKEQSGLIQQVKLEMQNLTQTILYQDQQVLAQIAKAKSNIISDLQNIKKNKKFVSSYKTKVDHHQIDEEI